MNGVGFRTVSIAGDSEYNEAYPLEDCRGVLRGISLINLTQNPFYESLRTVVCLFGGICFDTREELH